MSKFVGESANFSKNVRPTRNLSIIWREKLLKYPLPAVSRSSRPLLSGWAGSLNGIGPLFILYLPIHIEVC